MAYGKWQPKKYGSTGRGHGQYGAPAVRNEVSTPIEHKPSVYQQAILDWFKTETSNGIIQAVAGSGKTSTLVMLAREMAKSGKSGVFLAFNKAIAEELKRKLPANVVASTFHALGRAAIVPVIESRTGRKFGPKDTDAYKVDGIFDELYGKDEALSGAKSAVKKLVSLMKANVMMPDQSAEELRALMAHYDIESDDDSISDEAVIMCARAVLTRNNDIVGCGGMIDFDDMLYFVPLLGARVGNKYGSPWQYVMVDESQDTNAVQRDILQRLLQSGPRGNARLIAVGDEYQAIYGFRGADADSMALIRDTFGCVELPLSISYRCAASVVREAQQYVPHIEAREGASVGIVRGVSEWSVEDWRWSEGKDDLVVCRNNAPLLGVAYKCLKARVPVKVMGRDIGAGLKALIRRVAGSKCKGLSEFQSRLREWGAAEVSRCVERKQEGKAAAVADKVDCLLLLSDSLIDDGKQDITYLNDTIDTMFPKSAGEDGIKGKYVVCASVHKSKGLEARRVFVLDRGLMPSRWAKQEWELVQEKNLQYVSVTRAKEELVYVDSMSVE